MMLLEGGRTSGLLVQCWRWQSIWTRCRAYTNIQWRPISSRSLYTDRIYCNATSWRPNTSTHGLLTFRLYCTLLVCKAFKLQHWKHILSDFVRLSVYHCSLYE